MLLYKINENYADVGYSCPNKKNKIDRSKQRDHYDYFIDKFDVEKTPYSHKSDYEFPIGTKKCNLDKKNCLNSMCVFDSLNECQNNCKNGCQYCEEEDIDAIFNEDHKITRSH